MNRATNRKVVFFFPAFSSQEATAPLGILAVATPLLRAGYEVRIIDSTITPHFHERVLEELDDALCLAVSLVTGPMIRETVQIARAAKRLYPDKPVILGGWHPSLLPHQTLAAEYVDIVVKGQGEDALLEVVQRIEDGADMKGIAGVGYKEDGRFVLTRRARCGLSRKCRPRPIIWPISTPTNALRTPLGHVHVEPGVPVQLRLLHESTASTDANGTLSSPPRWWKRPPTW